MKITRFVLASLAMLFLYDAAYACRCMRIKPSANISPFRAVFTGKVIEVTREREPSGIERHTVTFEVERVWKDGIKKSVTLSALESSCSVLFREGESYLVFAFMSNDRRGLTTHKCTRTGPAADRVEDIELLGEGKIPEGG